MPLELPSNLVRQASREDPGSSLHGWLRKLPATVEQVALWWSLRLGRPYQPGVTWVFARCELEYVDQPQLVGVAEALAP